jgi:transposase
MRPTAYRRNAHGLRDRQAFERVRLQAGELFTAGRSQAEVARELGAARQSASRWHAQWRQGGLPALRSVGPTGPTPRLSEEQLHLIDQALRQGARAHGIDIDHWTLDRVATVIERLTGSAIIPATCGSCCAIGCTTACCAPPAAPSSVTSGPSPAGWPRTGPRIRANARRRRAAIVFWDESGASLLPVTRRTWVPRGCTPVIRHHFK